MSEDEKQALEILSQLMSSYWAQFERRRDFEWKLSFAVWTVLATLVGFLLTKDVVLSRVWLTGSCALFSVALFVLHLYWQRKIANRNDLDRDISRFCENVITSFLGIPDLPAELLQKREDLKKAKGLKNYSHRFQLAMTLVLGLALIGVSSARSDLSNLAPFPSPRLLLTQSLLPNAASCGAACA
jgi:hypothetical protein